MVDVQLKFNLWVASHNPWTEDWKIKGGIVWLWEYSLVMFTYLILWREKHINAFSFLYFLIFGLWIFVYDPEDHTIKELMVKQVFMFGAFLFFGIWLSDIL